jgi:cytoskeletal protein RodZ
MNANSKLDVHPDAEILNAFAEQALEERERGKIVAHLAACSRCRQVVYLAQDAAAEMVPSVSTPAVRLEGRRESWFRSWRFALVPVAALAAIAALAYIVHVQRIETGPEMAKVTPQTAPQNAGSNSAAPTPAKGVAAAPVSAGPGQSEARARKMAPAVTAWQKEQERTAATAEVHGIFAKTMAHASENESAKREETDRIVTAAAPQFDANPAPPASFEAGARSRAGGVLAIYKGNEGELPSGLAVVSTATSQHQTLAIDKAGSVFVREDSGGHWDRIAKQWTGQAVAVRMQADLGANRSGSAPSPEAVFELVNDLRQVWVSTDGRIWKAK